MRLHQALLPGARSAAGAEEEAILGVTPKQEVTRSSHSVCLAGSQHSLGAVISHWELPGSLRPFPIAPVPLLPRTRKAKRSSPQVSPSAFLQRLQCMHFVPIRVTEALANVSSLPTPHMGDQTWLLRNANARSHLSPGQTSLHGA